MYACLIAREPSSLLALARDFSPRVEVMRDNLVLVDLAGLGRLLGDAPAIAEALCRTANDKGLDMCGAIAPGRLTAMLVAHGRVPSSAGRSSVLLVRGGEEARALAPLPLATLNALPFEMLGAPSPGGSHPRAPQKGSSSHLSGTSRRGRSDPRARGSARHYRMAQIPSRLHASGSKPQANRPVAQPPAPSPQSPVLDDLIRTLGRWGISTLGEFAALPTNELFERLGSSGVAWQAAAKGNDVRPLVPTQVEEPFEARFDLEWPIEALEPLSFVLTRLLDPLCARLEREDLGAAVLQVTLRLVTREFHVRTLELPAPMRDPKVLRTLALLDLESHPPPAGLEHAGIDTVVITLQPTEGRIVQYSLLARALPSAESIATLTARLSAIMGADRIGSPALVDSWRPEAFDLQQFVAADVAPRAPATLADRAGGEQADDRTLPYVLRRWREPVIAQVRTEGGRPTWVSAGRLRGGAIIQAAGPWRTSGDWWTGEPWDRDEWDVVLTSGVALRLARDRRQNQWVVEAMLD